jgi:hypothetical protein
MCKARANPLIDQQNTLMRAIPVSRLSNTLTARKSLMYSIFERELATLQNEKTRW